jgi:hypothetical protein
MLALHAGPRIPLGSRIPLTDGFCLTRRAHLLAAARLREALAEVQDEAPEGGA